MTDDIQTLVHDSVLTFFFGFNLRVLALISFRRLFAEIYPNVCKASEKRQQVDACACGEDYSRPRPQFSGINSYLHSLFNVDRVHLTFTTAVGCTLARTWTGHPMETFARVSSRIRPG